MRDRGLRWLMVSLIAGTLSDVAAAQGPAGELSLDSLLNTRVSAASKYDQTTTEAPASVTIISSDQLERLGYSRLGQVMEGVRGFYLTDDRNYSYLGTRGFSRLTDYNNRILVLIDGHTLNEQTWGGAPIGDDLPLNLSAIERIEIIRGPGSALYGTSAVFAVINVVMRTAASIDGTAVGARIGSAGHRQVTVAMGRNVGRGLELSGSALVGQSEGDAFYFAEYDDPVTNHGRTFGTDWDRTASALGTIRWGIAALRSGYVSRSKGVATGAYEATFHDPRTSRHEQNFWTELALTRQFRDQFRISGRLYYDWSAYDGTFAGPEEPPYTDAGGSASVGTELLGIWDFSSKLRLTLGGEYRNVDRANYQEWFSDGTVSSDNAPFHVASLFAQAEYQLLPRLTTVIGVRTEEHSRSGSASAPRGALIFTPSNATTLKLLYGHAYRAPSVSEAHLETSFYQRNPELRPERIRTLELTASQRVNAAFLVAGSVYHYHLRDLIEQVEFTAEGALRFQNASHAEGSGLEVELDGRLADLLQLRGSFAYQRALLAQEEQQLTNGPKYVATLEATASRLPLVRPSVSLHHESGRITLAGATTEAFLRTDLHLGVVPRWGFDVGLRVSNLFDVEYAVPVGIEHRQDVIRQPGRRYSLYGRWRF